MHYLNNSSREQKLAPNELYDDSTSLVLLFLASQYIIFPLDVSDTVGVSE